MKQHSSKEQPHALTAELTGRLPCTCMQAPDGSLRPMSGERRFDLPLPAALDPLSRLREGGSLLLGGSMHEPLGDSMHEPCRTGGACSPPSPTSFHVPSCRHGCRVPACSTRSAVGAGRGCPCLGQRGQHGGRLQPAGGGGGSSRGRREPLFSASACAAAGPGSSRGSRSGAGCSAVLLAAPAAALCGRRGGRLGLRRRSAAIPRLQVDRPSRPRPVGARPCTPEGSGVGAAAAAAGGARRRGRRRLQRGCCWRSWRRQWRCERRADRPSSAHSLRVSQLGHAAGRAGAGGRRAQQGRLERLGLCSRRRRRGGLPRCCGSAAVRVHRSLVICCCAVSHTHHPCCLPAPSQHTPADGSLAISLRCAQPLSGAQLVCGVVHLTPNEHRSAAEGGKAPKLAAGYEVRRGCCRLLPLLLLLCAGRPTGTPS